MAEPYPKSKQLARGTRRYRRKVASPKQWQAISAAKIGPCRVCGDPGSNGRVYGRIQLHHVIPRDWHGDDLADNIVPLCQECHERAHVRGSFVAQILCRALTDAEYAYAVAKAGEDFAGRIYGVKCEGAL